eukprot:460073-Hanusia_phi.AAC.1
MRTSKTSPTPALQYHPAPAALPPPTKTRWSARSAGLTTTSSAVGTGAQAGRDSLQPSRRRWR